MPGKEGLAEGLVSITIGVKGKHEYDAILARARNAGIWNGDNFAICGIE
jgi:hypothetical protein